MYIITSIDELGQDGLILGAGETLEAAMLQTLETFGGDDGFDPNDTRGYEATDTLVTLLTHQGGDCSWRLRDDGVADIDDE